MFQRKVCLQLKKVWGVIIS